MSYQYKICTRDDYESSDAHDWHGRKDEITRRVKIEDPKFDGYYDLSVFSNWLTDVECYFDWYRFSDEAKLLFARRKLIGSANSY